MLAHAGTPAEEHAPPEWRSKILHACLEADGFTLMASDAPPAINIRAGRKASR